MLVVELLERKDGTSADAQSSRAELAGGRRKFETTTPINLRAGVVQEVEIDAA